MMKHLFTVIFLLTTSLLYAQQTLPYSFPFVDLTGWTVIDNNNDSKTWTSSGGNAQYSYSGSNQGDDWMISPAFNLETGKNYNVSFKMKTYNTSAPEHLKITLGKGSAIADQTTELLKFENYKNSTFVTQSKSFSVSESGLYHIGFYAYSPKNQWYIYVDDFLMEEILSYPAQISDLKATPLAQGALGCLLEWTNPVKDQLGNDLESLTHIKIYRNDKLIHTIDNPVKGATGNYRDESITVAGQYNYKVIASNIHGDAEGAPTAVTSSWIGEDIPAAVTSLTATAENNVVSLSFTPPAIGKNGGWIDLSSLSYQIVRNPGSTILEADYKGSLPYIDNQLGEVSAYIYNVKAKTAAGSATEVLSNKVIAGSAKRVPYSTGFSSVDDFALFTTIDSNNDGKTWAHNNSNSCARYEGLSKDWMISPSLSLEPGKTYELSFKTRVYGSATNNIKTLLITIGQGTTAESQSKELGLYTVNYALYNTQTVLFSVDKSGSWNIGFNCYSSSSSMQIDIDDILVKEVPTLPAPPTEGLLSEGENGAMNCLINWKNPSLSPTGLAISTLSAIKIYRGDELIYTKENPLPGAEESYTDSNITASGKYTYQIVPSTESGEGEALVLTSQWIGKDIPAAVTNLLLTSDQGVAVLTFAPPATGINGGWLDTDNLRYRIERNPGKVLLTDQWSATEYRDTDEKPLAAYSYIVTPVTGELSGASTTSNSLVFGEAISLPYTMNFTPSEDFGIWTVVDANDDNKKWGYNASKGQAEYTAYSNPNDYLFTPPFTTEAGLHTLAFAVKTYSGSRYPEQLKVVLGTSTDPADQTVVIDYPNLMKGLFDNMNVDVTIPSSGKWYIGFYLYSADPWGIQINKVSIEADPSVGVQEEKEKQYPPYYNALTQELIIPCYEQISSLRICNMAGECVYSSVQPEKVLPLSIWQKGIYLIHYRINNETSSIKFIK